MFKYGVSLFFAIISLVIIVHPLYSQNELSEVYSEANKTVAVISFEDKNKIVGSGVIVGTTGEGSAIILTAGHVVHGYQEVNVSFSGVLEDNYIGKVKEFDIPDTNDIGIIVVEDPPQNLEIIKFREPIAFKGETVGTIGHPLGETYTWSEGTISNISGDLIFHTAKLNEGSSGGPLLDECGRMLGMNVQRQEAEPEEGTSISLASASIISIMNGIFSETQFEKKWEYKKYCSFWERLYKNPFYIAGEAAALGGIVYLIFRSRPEPDPTFGLPPAPP